MIHKQKYLIKFILELVIAVGYLLSWLPILATFTFFGGYFALFWMIPLVIAVIVLDFIWASKELPVDVTNLIVASLLWIPLISLVVPLVGILISLSVAFINYSKIPKKSISPSSKKAFQENIIEVESRPIKEKN